MASIANDLTFRFFWQSMLDTGASLQAPPVEVNRSTSHNSGLSGLAVNVHRLRAACLATLRLDFALPKVCVTIPDDDEDKNDNLQVVCEDGPSSACITTLEDSDDGSLDQPLFETSEPPAGGNLGHGDHASNSAAAAAAGSQSSQPSQLDCQSASVSQVLSIKGAGRGRGRGRGEVPVRGRGEVRGCGKIPDSQALLNMPQHELARMYINQSKVLAKMRTSKRILTQEKQKLERKCKRLEKKKQSYKTRKTINSKFARPESKWMGGVLALALPAGFQ